MSMRIKIHVIKTQPMIKISILIDISITQIYRYIKKYKWIFWHKISIGENGSKTHENIEFFLKKIITNLLKLCC